jgi:hypothetical protein
MHRAADSGLTTGGNGTGSGILFRGYILFRGNSGEVRSVVINYFVQACGTLSSAAESLSR